MAASRNSPSADPGLRVAAFFAPRLKHGRCVCVALSGGCDSIALLRALAGARAGLPDLDLSAVHVHHGLSPHADAWADFCAGVCTRLSIPLRIHRVTVAADAGEGLEAAARRARYAAFAALVAAPDSGVDWLALAHHRDDQAETVLLNLLRGAGAEGLSGMPEERPMTPGSAVRLVRPLLPLTRRELEAWLRAGGHDWIDDESNDDRRLRRNFLRHEILPKLADVFPDPALSLARSAAHLGELADLAGELAAIDAAAVSDGIVLSLQPFNALSLARRANLLRHHLRVHGWRMPDTRYLGEILRQLANMAPGAQPVFPLDGGLLRVHRGALHLQAGPPVIPADRCWLGEPELPWGQGVLTFEPRQGAGIDRRRLETTVMLRTRRGGETLQPVGRPRRTLKNLLQEAAIPVWQRQCLPLLFCGDELAWVAGIGVDARFAAAAGEPGLLPTWQLPGRATESGPVG